MDQTVAAHRRSLREADPDIAAAIRDEVGRQATGLELIASENFVSHAVLEAAGSVFTNKYAEGYPGRRYYGGCEFTDVVERLAIDRAKALFGAEHANVQPHSGAQANMAVYFTLLKPGDTVLGMNLSHGGHLTHGHPLNFSGKLYTIVPYGVRQDDERLDYDEIERLAGRAQAEDDHGGRERLPARHRLRAGSAPSRTACGAAMVTDMAHIAGLVAGGVHPSPVPHSDFVTTTTHKTLRGPRAGLVLCKEKWAKDLDRSVFPGVQGGPLVHIIAAKAVCFKEALEPTFAAYQRQIVANAARARRRDRRARLPARLRRHGQPPDAGGRVLEGPHRQGRDHGARQGRHHRQPEHDPVRPEPAAQGERHPDRHARRDDARHGRGRDGASSASSSRACWRRPTTSACTRWCGPRWKPCAGSSRCTRTSWSRRARRRASSPTTARWRGPSPDFEPRPGQRDMAAAVARVLGRGGVLLAEAGTGTGKTLAYLAPAILSGHRVLVSTGTKNLQEQIYFKDLPVLPRGARASRSPPPT